MFLSIVFCICHIECLREAFRNIRNVNTSPSAETSECIPAVGVTPGNRAGFPIPIPIPLPTDVRQGCVLLVEDAGAMSSEKVFEEGLGRQYAAREAFLHWKRKKNYYI